MYTEWRHIYVFFHTARKDRQTGLCLMQRTKADTYTVCPSRYNETMPLTAPPLGWLVIYIYLPDSFCLSVCFSLPVFLRWTESSPYLLISHMSPYYLLLLIRRARPPIRQSIYTLSLTHQRIHRGRGDGMHFPYRHIAIFCFLKYRQSLVLVYTTRSDFFYSKCINSVWRPCSIRARVRNLLYAPPNPRLPNWI